MARALHFPTDREALRAGFRELLARLNGDGTDRAYRLVAANSLWGQRGDRFLPAFVRTLADVYRAEIESVDFHGAAEAAARRSMSGSTRRRIT